MPATYIRYVFIILLLITSFAGESYSQERKTFTINRLPVVREFNEAFKNKPEQEIESMEHQLSDAIRLKDAAKLEILLADTVLVAGLVADKKKYIAYLLAVETKYYSLEKSGMRIKIYDNTAVATGTLKSEIDIENGSRFSQSIFINTWKLIDSKWQCIALAN